MNNGKNRNKKHSGKSLVKNLTKKLSMTMIVSSLVFGLVHIPDNNSSIEYNDTQEISKTNNSANDQVYDDNELRKTVVNKIIDESKIGYAINDLNVEIRVPIEAGEKYKTEQLDENGEPIKVLNERTGVWETQYVVKRKKVDQIIKVDHGSGVMRFPGNPKDAYCHFDMPLSYMDKVMVNIETFFYEQCCYCEYQGSDAKYFLDNKETIWKDRDVEHCLNWENIKYRLSTHLGPRTELIDVDGEMRYVYEPSELEKVLSHFINFAVQCGVLSNKNLNKLLHKDNDVKEAELAKNSHHSTPNYKLDSAKIFKAIMNMKPVEKEDGNGFDLYVKVPVEVASKPTIKEEYVGLHLACDSCFNLTKVELPGYEVKDENNWEFIKLNGGDLKLKIDADLEGRSVEKPNYKKDHLDKAYTPFVDSLSLFDSILKFVTKPKLKYKTDITIDHIVNGPCYGKLTNGQGEPVNFYDPKQDLEWYKEQGINTSALRKGDDPRNIMETAYIDIDGATNFGDGFEFSDITSIVATDMGYDIDIGIVEDEIDSFGKPVYENGQKKRINSSKHKLYYSWDKNFDNGKGMNYFEYQGVAKYKAHFVDFNKLLGKIMNLSSKFFSNDNDKNMVKADFWKYVDALGESNIRRTLGLLINDVFKVLDDEDYAASVKEGNVKDLTDIVTKIEVYKDGSGGETILDFSTIGLVGKIELIAKNNAYPGYTVKDPDHKSPIEGMNDKFEWKFIGIELGGFELNGTIDFVACEEDDEYFLDKYVKCYGPQNADEEKTYQPIKYFNDVTEQLLSFNDNRQIALKMEAKAMEDKDRGDKRAGFDLISKGAVDFEKRISWSEHSLLKYSPTFSTADLKEGRSGGRCQEFVLDLDIIEATKDLVKEKLDEEGNPVLDNNDQPVLEPIYIPGTTKPIQVVDTDKSNVFIRLGSSTTTGRAKSENERLDYRPPRRCYVDKYGDAPHPIEGWASIEAYIDLFELGKSVLQETPDSRFSKFATMLSTDVQASTTLDTVIDKAKNGNMLNPLLSTKFITKIEVGPDNSMIFNINKDLAGGKLAKDIEIIVSTKKHKFNSEEEERRYNELHPDHEARDVSGIRFLTKFGRNELADGMMSYDGLDIDVSLHFEDYNDEYRVEDNFKFTENDSEGNGPHDTENKNYMDFTTVEFITQSALNSAWLGSGARYFKENGHIDLRECVKNNKKIIDTANMLGLSGGEIIEKSEQVGPSTYHIRLRFTKLKGQFILNVDFSYLSMDFWVYLDGEKCRVMCIINMPLQQGFNDNMATGLFNSSYYGGGKLGSTTCFVKSMILYEVGYTPKEQWTDIDKKLNRDTGKVYMFRSYNEISNSSHKAVDYRMTTGYFFRRHIQEWIQFYILGDHYMNGGLMGQREKFVGKEVYPGNEHADKSGNVGLLNAVFYPEDILNSYSFEVNKKNGDEIQKCTWNMDINYHDLVNFDVAGLKTGYVGDADQKNDGPVKINLVGISWFLKQVKFNAAFHPMKVISNYVYADFDGYADLYNLDENGNYTNCWNQKANEQFTFKGQYAGNSIVWLFDSVSKYCDTNFVETPIPWCDYKKGKFVRNTYPDDYTRNGYCWLNKNGHPSKEKGDWKQFADWSAHDAKGRVHY